VIVLMVMCVCVCVCVCVHLRKWPTDCIRRNVRFLFITTVYQLLRLFGSTHDGRVLVGNTFKINGRKLLCGIYDEVKRRLTVIVTYYNLLTVSYVTQRALVVFQILFFISEDLISDYIS
jgi:hypothetical protein